jgi:O-antigen/teichoic acid export membrane protein
LSTLRRNIAANLGGSLWTGLMSIVLVPLYIHLMGIEAYGLIGIFASLQTIFGLLDMGLNATVTREMARLSVLPGKETEMRDLVRSLEMIYWGAAVVIGALVFVVSPFIAHEWVKPGRFTQDTVEQAFQIMGVAMALQWPSSFYSGGLMGLQKQVLLNAATISMNALRGTGAILVLWLISPTILAFLIWQTVVSAATTSLLAYFLWHRLPRNEIKATFQKHLVSGIWRFAAGMSGISVLATILTQLDKVILSNLLALDVFGYYTLAGVVAMSLYRLSSPVFSAIYPRFTQLVSVYDSDGLKRLYHASAQLLSVLILPATAVIAMFSEAILAIWTQNPTTAANAHQLVSILVCGTALNVLGHVPYALQLSNAWTKLALYGNSIAIMILVPMIVYMTDRYGAVGAASVWVILNAGYVLIAVPLVHQHLLPGQNRRWYCMDVGLPILASFGTAGLGRVLVAGPISTATELWHLTVVLLSTYSVTALSTQTTRDWVLSRVQRRRGPGNHRELVTRDFE